MQRNKIGSTTNLPLSPRELVGLKRSQGEPHNEGCGGGAFKHTYIRLRPIWCRVGCENRKHKTCIERAIISPARRRLHPLWPRATHSGLSPTAQSVHRASEVRKGKSCVTKRRAATFNPLCARNSKTRRPCSVLGCRRRILKKLIP